MPAAMDVANFFIHVFKNTDEPMTMLRAMKLTYYAQGGSLSRLGEPLFDEDMEAWAHGPVVPSVYKALSHHKKGMIKKTVGEYSRDLFSKEQIEVMTDVAVKYGRYTTGALLDMCHAPGGPWSSVYVPNMNIKIPKEAIREHFSTKEPLKEFDMDLLIGRMRSVQSDNKDVF